MAGISVVDLAKALKEHGLTSGQHPEVGSGKVGKHAPGSYHYSGKAIDVTDWRPDIAPAYQGGPAKDWKTRTGELSWRFKQLAKTVPGLTEVLGPGDPGHSEHVHIAIADPSKAAFTPAQLEWGATGRWKTPEGKLMATMPGAQQLQQAQPTEQATEDPGKKQLTEYLQRNNELISQLVEQSKPKDKTTGTAGLMAELFSSPSSSQDFLSSAIAAASKPTQYV